MRTLSKNTANFRTELQHLNTCVESHSSELRNVRNIVSYNTIGTDASQQLIDPRRRVAGPLHTLMYAIHELLMACLDLLWPLVLSLLYRIRTATMCLIQILVGDSIIFHDALGRTQYLHLEYFQHWAVFLPTFTRLFKGYQGFTT